MVSFQITHNAMNMILKFILRKRFYKEARFINFTRNNVSNGNLFFIFSQSNIKYGEKFDNEIHFFKPML